MVHIPRWLCAAAVLFGAFGAKDDCLVLTEDDYLDFLISSTATKLIPVQVERALVDNSLLFLGFRPNEPG